MAKTGSIGFDRDSATGSLELIEHITASGAASVDFTGIAGYKMLQVQFDLSTDTDNTTIIMKLNNDGGANYGYSTLAGTTLANATGQTSFPIAVAQGALDKTIASGMIVFPVITNRDSGKLRCCPGFSYSTPGTDTHASILKGDYVASADLTRITFTAGSGNLTGDATLWGVKE